MAIQPKNHTEIRADKMQEKTAAAGVSIHTAKQLSSNGQGLLVGTESAHDVTVMTQSIQRYAFDSSGNITQKTSGGSAIFRNPSTVVVGGKFAEVAAAGSTISDATDLTAVFNSVSPVASGAGAQLWDAPLDAVIQVLNNQGANSLSLYPHAASVSMNHYAVGEAAPIAANEMAICVKKSSTEWFVRVVPGVVLP